MLHTQKLEILEKINYLLQLANKGRDNFPDEVCEFFVNQFELDSAVLFKVVNSSSLFVLGKSASAKKNFIKGSSFTCNACKAIADSNKFSIHSDSNCQLQVSEFVIYESCVSFELSSNERGLLKIAKKTPFSSSDTEAIRKAAAFVSESTKNWFGQKGSSLNNTDDDYNILVQKSLTELRAPANSIIGFTSILSDDNLTSSQAEYLSTIKSNAQKLLLTINDILDITKLESGTIHTNLKSTNFKVLLTEITNMYKQKSVNRALKYNLSLEDSIDVPLMLDDKKLRFILNNLFLVVSNLSYDGDVNISAIKPGEEILLTISSPTANIADDKKNSLFTLFATNSIDELKNTNLTGLGLPLVKKYVEAIGGNVEVFNSNSPGLNIKLTLNSSKEKSVNNVLSQIPKPSDTNRILVIEDDYATSKLMSNYLGKWGYNPTIVNTRDQALTQINNEKFLAVILDIELPNTNGLELLKEINHHPNSKNTPVIVCSIEAEQQKAFLMGAVEYFVKPINYNYLVEILTSYKLRKNSNILCVDDDLPTLNLVKQAIETAGFNAIAEHISANVMDVISNKQIELAIIDLDMPHPNGFELIQLIKSNDKFKNLPIIIYTGKENYKEDLQKIDGLFSHLLEKKSTNIEDLADTIEKMVTGADITPEEKQPVEEKEEEIKILLAEDYKHSQIIVTRLLKKNGFNNIVVVENGDEAYKKTKEEKFNLILMDMQMPIMNGFEATEHIRQLPEYKETPVIALTAFAMKGDREKCLDAGATDYIPKPIDSKEFIEKVKYYTSQ